MSRRAVPAWLTWIRLGEVLYDRINANLEARVQDIYRKIGIPADFKYEIIC
ncbi:hypothetical protein ACFLW6_01000 [Chloroflexota bacterium]